MGNTANQIIHKGILHLAVTKHFRRKYIFFLTGYDLQISVPNKAFQSLDALSNTLETRISGRKIKDFSCTCALVRASFVYV